MAGKIITVGIAGQGRSGFDIHAAWLRQATKQYRIVAVCDLMPDRRAQAASELGCRTHETYQELIRDGQFDLFVNSLPSFLHPKGTIAALNAGLNVVCEKPLATKVSDFDKMTAAAKKSRRMFAPFQNSRFWPFFWKMQEVIASGVLGRIVHARIDWSGFGRRWDWQTLQEMWGGNLNNTGPHPMDHAIMLFGNRTPKVFARMESAEGSLGDADDFAAVTLYGKDSPTVEVLVSSYMLYPRDMYVICGTRGGLAGNYHELRWKYYDPAKAPKQKLQPGWAENRDYCREELPWVHKTWKPRKTKLNEFQTLSKGYYDNIYNVLTKGAKLIVSHAQVRRQVGVLEECHRQNRLPKMREKFANKKL